MVKFLLSLLLICTIFNSQAQQYPFINFSTEEGLPQSQVTSFAQDSLGYLWVGTLGGLARFNGAEFKTYSSEDGLLNNRVTKLSYFDDRLWVGHDGGISFIYNNKVESFLYEVEFQSKNVSEILRFKKNIVVCSNGGGLFVFEDEKLKPIDLGNPDYERIRGAVVSNGKLLLATRAGVLETSDMKSFQLVNKLETLSFSDIDIDDKYLYYTTFANVVYRQNLSSDEVTKFSYEIDDVKFLNACVDHKGVLWMSSHDGIVKMDSDGKFDALNEENGLPINMINCIFEGWDDNIWIGSLGKGFFRFPGEKFRFFDTKSGLPSNLYLCGFQEKNGSYLLGTYDRGIVRIRKDGSSEVASEIHPLFWACVRNVDGKNWFGAQEALVVMEHGEFYDYPDRSNLPGDKITAFYKIDATSMYVGGHKGVSIYKNGQFKKLGRNVDEIGTVRDFAVLDGVLYCASHFGVFRLIGNEYHLLDGADQVVYNIETDKFGNLWIAGEEGLFKYRDGKITKFRLRDDPASNFINFVIHKDGILFVGSNNGLFVISDLESEKMQIKRFGKGDGILDPETNLNSAFFDASGELWFGTASGLVIYKADNVQSQAIAARPVVDIVEIKLNYESFNYADYSDEQTKSGFPKSLNLPHSKNNIIFSLDGISLAHHKGMKYQFYLEGLNDSWSPPSEVSMLTFTSLPSGNYKLLVRAIDVDGRVSDPVEFSFQIFPPYYFTWWFILLVFGCAMLLFVFILRMREVRIREAGEKEKLEYKARLLALEQKSINASMNRHFIFNALNSIQYFINTQDRLSANKYLTNFAKLIRKNLDSATSENNTVTLEEEIDRIKLYLSLEAMRFQDRFDYNISVGDLDTESIIIPSMIMQPFVENSIIHGILPNESKKGQIDIRIDKNDGFLEIEIRDNGIGITNSISKKREIKGDHKSQGMEITSKRIELIQKISNNGISLEGPKEIVDENGLINGTVVLIKAPLDHLDNYN